MNKLISAVLLALLAALVPTGAFAAEPVNAKYGTGYFTVGNASLPASGCINHPMRADVNIGYETDGWFIDVTVAGPAGVADSWVSEVYWDDWGASYFEETVMLCTGMDVPGAYQITGTVHTVNNGSSTVVDQPLTPATFNVSGYVAPTPPPPPAPVVTYADVKGTVSKKFVERGVTFTFKAKPIPVGAVVRNKLAWSVVIDGKVRSFTQSPDSIKKKTYKFAKRSGVHDLKVLRNGKVAMKVKVRA